MNKPDNNNIFARRETERLILKPVDMSDRDFIFRHFSDPDVTRYLVDEEPLTSLAEAEELINRYVKQENPRFNRWILVTKSEGVPIGTCGYHLWNGKDNIAEIGYDLSSAYWGKGYMTEALTSALQVGFEGMGLNRIQAFVDPHNTGSINLAKRMGFTLEGIIRDHLFFRGEYYDDCCFSLLRREWEKP